MFCTLMLICSYLNQPNISIHLGRLHTSPNIWGNLCLLISSVNDTTNQQEMAPLLDVH